MEIKSILESSSEVFRSYEKIISISDESIRRNSLLHAKHLHAEFVNHLKLLSEGKTPLQSDEYFRRITGEIMSCSSGQEVIAVHSFDERRLNVDVLQANYIEKNLQAADRGVIIKRVFVINEHHIDNKNYRDAFRSIKAQIDHENIDIILVSSTAVYPDCEDWVMFPTTPRKIYFASPGRGSLKLHVDCAHLVEDNGGSLSNIYKEKFIELTKRVDQTIYERVFNNLKGVVL